MAKIDTCKLISFRRNRKYMKSVLSISISLIILIAIQSNTFALNQAPVAFDDWTAASGVIDTTVSCSSPGVSCEVILEEPGFKYEWVTVGANKYTRMILTEKTASPAGTTNAADLGFTTETFVPFSCETQSTEGFICDVGIDQGIASKQAVRENIGTGVKEFETKTEIAGCDYCFGGNDNTIKIDQSLIDPGSAKSFHLINYSNWAGKIGQEMSISQTNDIDLLTGDKQRFEYRSIGGCSFVSWWVCSPGGWGWGGGGTALSNAGSMTLGGTLVSWNAKDYVNTMWIGQTTGSPGGFALSGNNTFGLQQVNVDKPGGGSAKITDLTTTGLFDWDANVFGPEPTF